MKGNRMQPLHHNSARYVLTLAVASARGQVAALTALLERHGAYIEEFAVFDDVLVSRFFIRTVFRLDDAGPAELGILRDAYARSRPSSDPAQSPVPEPNPPTRGLLLAPNA